MDFRSSGQARCTRCQIPSAVRWVVCQCIAQLDDYTIVETLAWRLCWHVHFLSDGSSKTIVHIELEEDAAWDQVAPTVSRSEFMEVIIDLYKHNTYSTSTIDYLLPHFHLSCFPERIGRGDRAMIADDLSWK